EDETGVGGPRGGVAPRDAGKPRGRLRDARGAGLPDPAERRRLALEHTSHARAPAERHLAREHGRPGAPAAPGFRRVPLRLPAAVVDSATPTTRITFTYADESDDVPYPFTTTTPIEPASDAHAFMLNKDTCVLYELFAASWNGGRPTAGSGAVFDLRSRALRPAASASADAAGLPIW